jgi:hypothetical protein
MIKNNGVYRSSKMLSKRHKVLQNLATTVRYWQANTREEAVSVAKVNTTGTTTSSRGRRPALTPEARENQLIDLAVELAEKQLLEGTASSQVITHYLKLGSTRERLERERLEEENRLLRAKTKALADNEERKVLYEEAIKAMRRYNGHGDELDD